MLSVAQILGVGLVLLVEIQKGMPKGMYTLATFLSP